MASVWMELKGKAPVKVDGMLDGQEAMSRLKQRANAWMHAAPNRAIKRGEALTLLCFENKALHGAFWVEPMSPPSKPEPGQPHKVSA